MLPHFTVFSNCPTYIVKKLRSVFGEVFVDNETTNTIMIRARYKDVNGTFYYIDEDLDFCVTSMAYYKVDYNCMPSMPYLMLSYDAGRYLTDEDDDNLIENFVKAVFDNCNCIPDHIPEKFFELVPKQP